MTRLVAAFALLFSVFAHQVPAARALDPVAASYLPLPDGTIADICFGTDGVSDQDHSVPHEKQAPFCDYCRLASTAFVPEAPHEHFLVRGYLRIAERAVFEPALVDRYHPRPHARAPPALA
ncbi:hypothetical protein QO002_002571 [Pararhizobium capsulatum DSM 1112]|uniref:DUF2946 domain-containing protein n=1 Tax=Pararhizobium capsulatum DSM 1112 TaxID=1121113 RepID=A0ABU0BQB1_9HYPH|nr:hypothetical protein [Pararhizobium capsulatum]MDQ0320433.1 hypothetical protein [Pararhizobium capsulatum DSM 1112]